MQRLVCVGIVENCELIQGAGCKVLGAKYSEATISYQWKGCRVHGLTC
jgi:hypothetical protein